ncbi:tetratricopeptide repeat protein [Spirosoma areae]
MKTYVLCFLGFAALLAFCHQVQQKTLATYAPTGGISAVDTAMGMPIPLCRGAIARLSPTDLPAPRLLTGIGTVHFTISSRLQRRTAGWSKNATSQRWFDQGLNLLYGFWHIEAYRAFKQAIQLDSTCAMNYWGLALCQPGFASENNAEWTRAIDHAMSLRTSRNIRPLERALIEATATLTHKGPDAAFGQFQALAQTFPDDADAVAMAAIFMRQASKDMNGPVGDAIKASLERAIKIHPDHLGLLHHYIHLLELRPDFAQAIPVARHMVTLAPNSPHITHMPGHLYFLAGQYDKAAAAYQLARNQDEQYHATTVIPRDANQNYLHNLHFLAVAEAELGHYDQALDAANAYANTTLTTTATDGGSLMLLYEGRILPALVHIRFRQWQKASEYLTYWLGVGTVRRSGKVQGAGDRTPHAPGSLPRAPRSPLPDPLVRAYLQAMLAYSQGMLATEGGDIATAQQQLTQLSSLMQQYTQAGSQQQGHMAFRSLNETYDIMDIARLELTGWLVNRQPGPDGRPAPFDGRAFTEAMELEKAITYDEPPRLMYPVTESLGMLHFRRGEIQQARDAFQLALARRPNSPLIMKYLTQTIQPFAPRPPEGGEDPAKTAGGGQVLTPFRGTGG